MARPLKPFVRGGGYYPSRKWTPLVYNGGYTTKRDGSTPPTPEYWKTVTGISPLALVNSLAKPLRSLTRYGKCTQPAAPMYSTITQRGKLVQDGTPTPTAPVDIVCNNGTLCVDANGEVYGNDPETLTIGNQTVRVADLLAIGDYKDALEIVSGVKTKRIRARVLTGSANENWFKPSDRNVFSASAFFSDMIVKKTQMYCTHFVYSDDASTSIADLCFGSANTSTNTFFRYDAISTVEGWCTFLAEQLAAGTPVIIVYVLADETTEQLAPADIDLTYKPITVTTAVGDVTITETHAAVSTPSPRTPLPIRCNNGVLQANVSILDPTNIYGNYLLRDNGTIGSAAANFYLTNFIPVKPSTSYTFSFRSGADAQYRRLAEYESADENTFVKLTIKMPRPTAVDDVITRTFVTSPTTNYIRLSSSALDTEQSIRLTDYALNEVYADGTPETLTIGGGSRVPDGYTELKTVRVTDTNFHPTDEIAIKIPLPVDITTMAGKRLTVRHVTVSGVQQDAWYDDAAVIPAEMIDSTQQYGECTFGLGYSNSAQNYNVCFGSGGYDMVNLNVYLTAEQLDDVDFVYSLDSNLSPTVTIGSTPITVPSGTIYQVWDVEPDGENWLNILKASFNSPLMVGDNGRVILDDPASGTVYVDACPCIRNSDNAIGYYEIVGGAFYAAPSGMPLLAGDPAPASGQTVDVAELLGISDNYTDRHEIIEGIKTGKVGIKVLTGAVSEGWADYATGDAYIRGATAAWGAVAGVAPICNRLVGLNAGEDIYAGACRFATDFNVYDYKAAFGVSDITEFRAKLAAYADAGKPLMLIYARATETAEQLTPQPVDGIDGTTTITSSSPVEAKMTVVYGSSEE